MGFKVRHPFRPFPPMVASIGLENPSGLDFHCSAIAADTVSSVRGNTTTFKSARASRPGNGLRVLPQASQHQPRALLRNQMDHMICLRTEALREYMLMAQEEILNMGRVRTEQADYPYVESTLQ